MTPLPHGTEVTTRAERQAGARRLAVGVIGRVVRARDGGYDVHFVGVGEVWFAHDELLPRKTGQLDFAVRPEAAWLALRPCVVLCSPASCSATATTSSACSATCSPW